MKVIDLKCLTKFFPVILLYCSVSHTTPQPVCLTFCCAQEEEIQTTLKHAWQAKLLF